MPRRQLLIWLAPTFSLAWVVLVALGVRALMNYENAPGKVAAVPQSWPESNLPRMNDRPTLVMLAHPHCPCTRASIGELAQVMARAQGKAVAYVLFARPVNAGADWDDTDLRRSAAEIPGVQVVSDEDGSEARRFGAETSGHTLLFAPDGTLLFSGGITPSRGHAGDNVGESSIIALINGERLVRAESFVFGCPLPGSSDERQNLAVALQ